MKLPELPPALLVMRKIRGCEGEAAAQLVLEKYALAYGEMVREECARICEEEGKQESAYDAAHYDWCAAAIREKTP